MFRSLKYVSYSTDSDIYTHFEYGKILREKLIENTKFYDAKIPNKYLDNITNGYLIVYIIVYIVL